MNGLEECEVSFLARHRVRDHLHTEQNVVYFGEPIRSSWLTWKLGRLRQELTRVYTRLRRGELARLERLLRERSPQLVHAHWGPDAMLVQPVCWRLRIPLLVHFHGYDVSRLAGHRVYLAHLRRLFAKMDLALTVCEEMRQRLIRLGCPSDRVVRHYTGVPDKYFRVDPRPPVPGEPFVFLQVGRLAEKKGHNLTIRALSSVQSRHRLMRLRVVGEGPLRRDLEDQIAAAGLAASVEMLGRRTPDQVLAELGRAHALLAPSHTAPDGDAEGLPNVVVEALAAGIPVVATMHGGIPEAVRYSEPRWLVAEGDLSGFSQRLTRLASEPGLWQRLSAEGKYIARSDFHLVTQNRRLEEVYLAILNRRIPNSWPVSNQVPDTLACDDKRLKEPGCDAPG